MEHLQFAINTFKADYLCNLGLPYLKVTNGCFIDLFYTFLKLFTIASPYSTGQAMWAKAVVRWLVLPRRKNHPYSQNLCHQFIS